MSGFNYSHGTLLVSSHLGIKADDMTNPSTDSMLVSGQVLSKDAKGLLLD